MVWLAAVEQILRDYGFTQFYREPEVWRKPPDRPTDIGFLVCRLDFDNQGWSLRRDLTTLRRMQRRGARGLEADSPYLSGSGTVDQFRADLELAIHQWRQEPTYYAALRTSRRFGAVL